MAAFSDDAFKASTQDPSSLQSALAFMSAGGSCFERDHLKASLFPAAGGDLGGLLASVRRLAPSAGPPPLWNDGGPPLCLRFSPSEEASEGPVPHLAASVYYGDDVDDEWRAIECLFRITKALPGVTAQALDSADGDVLLIEAADHIPDELSPDNAENRTFVRDGRVYILPPGQDGGDRPMELGRSLQILGEGPKELAKRLASLGVQRAIQAKLATAGKPAPKHVARAVLPLSVASVLEADPSLGLLAADAFAAGARANPVNKLKRFPTKDGTKACAVALTRCMYAKLRQGEAAAPPKGTFLEAELGEGEGGGEGEAAVELGVKLTIGFELLWAGKGGAEPPVRWGVEGGGGVKEEIAKIAVKGRGELKAVRKEDVSGDEWMTVNHVDDFEAMMRQAVGGAMGGAVGGGGDGGAGFEALAKTMDSFVQKQSDVAGVVVEAGAEAEEAEAVREGDVEIDGDKFASILAGLVGGDMRGGGGGGGGGGLDFSDDEDGEDGEGERGEQGEEELAMEEELQKGGVLREGDVNVDVSVVEGLMQSLLEEEGGTGPASTLLKQMNIK